MYYACCLLDVVKELRTYPGVPCVPAFHAPPAKCTPAAMPHGAFPTATSFSAQSALAESKGIEDIHAGFFIALSTKTSCVLQEHKPVSTGSAEKPIGRTRSPHSPSRTDSVITFLG